MGKSILEATLIVKKTFQEIIMGLKETCQIDPHTQICSSLILVLSILTSLLEALRVVSVKVDYKPLLVP